MQMVLFDFQAVRSTHSLEVPIAVHQKLIVVPEVGAVSYLLMLP